MASSDNTAAAAAQLVPETTVAIGNAAATTTAMAPAAVAAPATATAATTASANDAEASSSQAAADLAVTFPLPSMAAAEATVDAGAATTTELLTEEEENLAERSRYWLPSCVTEDHLAELVEGGFLPPKAECSWRAPGDETVQTPQGDERVILVSHLLRGMTLPPSAFFSSVLDYYGLQPHNIAPNSILVLASFQALFEGYLGISPTVDHFKQCFLCRRQTVASSAMAICCSVTLNCRQGD